jgi:hypothetical protein
MTQKERVLERLSNGQWLPMPEALRWSPPITRLGARIFDLRAEVRIPGHVNTDSGAM